MDLLSLLEDMETDGSVLRITRNPLAQFGTRTRRYLGATILPERPVTENAFTEDVIRYRTNIANAGTRYSPVQLKEGVMTGSFLVKLAESDIGSEFKGRDYDALLRHLARSDSMAAIHQLVRFLDTTVNLPLVEWNERARWQAIVDAVVELRGNNGYTEDVAYSNPTGHRVPVAGAWSTDTNDPYADIFAIVQMLADKGMTVARIITSRRVIGILAGNDIVKTRTSRVVVNTSGQIEASPTGRLTLADLNGINQADGLPPFELYDLSYRTSTGSGRFMPDDVMVFVTSTGRDEELDIPDRDLIILPDTLGYMAVGRPTGQSDPGRVIISTPFRNKPPRIENEGWQTSLPVITEPEGLAVIHSIT